MSLEKKLSDVPFFGGLFFLDEGLACFSLGLSHDYD
jgi:hypothetical protein